MAKITNEEDVPPWYKKSRYADLKLAVQKGAYEHIINEIEARKYVYEELYPNEVKSIFQEAGFRHLRFQNELFNEREPYKDKGELRHVINEIDLRKWDFKELYSHPLQSLLQDSASRRLKFQNELLKQRERYKAKEQCDLKIDERGDLSNVKTMEIRDLDFLSSEIKELEDHQNTIFDKDEYIHKVLNTGSILCSTQAKISIDLRFATNAEILNELEKLLPILRKDIDNKEPKRYNFNHKCYSLFSCCVFEYLDLTLWAKANGHELTNKSLARILNNGNFDEKEIVSKVRKHAMHALSDEFIDQLYLHR